MFGKKSDDQAAPAQVPGRNDPCHCGSGKKYKKCHEDKDATTSHAVLEKKWQEGEKVAAKQVEEEKKEGVKQPQTNTPHRPSQLSQTSKPKHNTFTAPKFNTPRKTGGGGA